MNVRIRRTELVRLVEQRIVRERDEDKKENDRIISVYIQDLEDTEKKIKTARQAASRKVNPSCTRIDGVYARRFSENALRLEGVLKGLKADSREFLSVPPELFQSWT